jgi:hypothetical protein
VDSTGRHPIQQNSVPSPHISFLAFLNKMSDSDESRFDLFIVGQRLEVDS